MSLAQKAHKLGEKHPKTIEAIRNLATVYKNKGNKKSALECYKSVYDLCREVFGENDDITIAAKNVLLSAMRN